MADGRSRMGVVGRELRLSSLIVVGILKVQLKISRRCLSQLPFSLCVFVVFDDWASGKFIKGIVIFFSCAFPSFSLDKELFIGVLPDVSCRRKLPEDRNDRDDRRLVERDSRELAVDLDLDFFPVVADDSIRTRGFRRPSVAGVYFTTTWFW